MQLIRRIRATWTRTRGRGFGTARNLSWVRGTLKSLRMLDPKVLGPERCLSPRKVRLHLDRTKPRCQVEALHQLVIEPAGSPG